MKSLSFAILIFFFQALHADQVHLLAENNEALQARVDLILNAKEIIVETYSFADDDVSLGVYALLLQAANRGADVKILVDAFTNKTPDKTLAALMEISHRLGKSNFQIRVYNPYKVLNLLSLTHRTHAKIVMADGQEMITGGRNIGENYFGLNSGRNFVDTDVYVSGETVTKTRENFLQLWNSSIVGFLNLSKDVDPDIAKQNCESQSNDMQCSPSVQTQRLNRLQKSVSEFQARSEKIIASGFNLGIKYDNRNSLWLKNSVELSAKVILDPIRQFMNGENESNGIGAEYVNELSKAEQTLTIVSPYMIPTAEQMNLFRTLLAQKVKIKLITNSITSSDDMRAVAGYHSHKDEIIKLGPGLEIYEYNGPSTLHSKLAVIDDETGVVGTFNFDPRSHRLNREMALVVEDRKGRNFINNLNSEILKLQQNSLLVGKDGKPKNLEIQSQRRGSEDRLKKVKLYLNLMPMIHDQL